MKIMENTSQTIKCFSCKGLAPDVDGPTHAYMLSSPGCWKLYCEILAKEYTPENYDPNIQSITADTYATQHPGKPERRAIQSVNGHLMSLYVVFEKGLRVQEAHAVLIKAVEDKEFQKQFQWLEPPSFDGTLSVSGVIKARDFERVELVRKWGDSVWHAWKRKHYATIAGLADKAINSRR